MRHGVTLFTSDRGITPAAAARAAEECGFDTFYVPEHTHIPVERVSKYPGTDSTELPERYSRMLDPWVSLSTAASVTSRIRLGTSVALVLEHDPISLAKAIASLDHLSGGRVTLGVGYGWNAEELADHGVDPKKRRSALREYLEAMQALWTQEEASYDGQFVKFSPSWAWPKPIQQPCPPVLVGAGASEKTFAWIARSADGWITTPRDEDIEDGIVLLQRIWAEAGRAGQPEIVALASKRDADKLARWEDLGVTEALFGMPEAEEEQVVAYLQRLADRLGLGA
ncbi:LLM class F420-dependent oxidoreductase [Rhodococcus spongiicola]|uniref:LLM class F420-dependent oxidoreductase n=1 Tax=Rhodococcus spongiicola TaxID=2487352 RepID=A0A3S3CM43_9NOCA|nr:LLM class F420-dependent oxidoreductase [Rhodococcus spongiicola]RVW00833.1 LLM class F420-dependent oxidoreductase [Rhodococcus spongiicola]